MLVASPGPPPGDAIFFSSRSEPFAGPVDLPQGRLAPVPASLRPDYPGGGGDFFAMPYRANSDLPPSVRHHLPDHAQDIYRETFNHAFAGMGGGQAQLREGARSLGQALARANASVRPETLLPQHDRIGRSRQPLRVAAVAALAGINGLRQRRNAGRPSRRDACLPNTHRGRDVGGSVHCFARGHGHKTGFAISVHGVCLNRIRAPGIDPPQRGIRASLRKNT